MGDVWLFHYTNKDSALKILQSGHIKKSTDPNSTAFGPGVYLTEKPPTSDWLDIALNNWDSQVQFILRNKNIQAKTEVAFGVPLSAIPETRKVGAKDRNVWVYPYDLILVGKPGIYWCR